MISRNFKNRRGVNAQWLNVSTIIKSASKVHGHRNSYICPHSFCVVAAGPYPPRGALSTQTLISFVLSSQKEKCSVLSLRKAKINIRDLMKSHMQVKSICTPPLPVSDFGWCPGSHVLKTPCMNRPALPL